MTRMRIALACAAALAAGGAAAVAAADSPPAAAQRATCTFSHQGMSLIDNRPRGESIGDIAIDRYVGTLAVQGLSGGSRITRFAVTGGTGRYAGATGALASQSKGRALTVTVELR